MTFTKSYRTKQLMKTSLLAILILSSISLPCLATNSDSNGHVEFTKNPITEEVYRKISDEKAVDLAVKAVKKKKLFGGTMPQYDETKVQDLGTTLRVTFVRYLPPGVLGSENMLSVDLDAHTGNFISFLGY